MQSTDLGNQVVQHSQHAPVNQKESSVLPGHIILVALLFIAAITVRLYRLSEPPLNYHATRQYRSLIIARGFYYEHLSGIPDWKKQVARINQQRQGILEPPVMEILTSVGYRLMGEERYWLPRSLSALFWLFGGGFLYLIAKRIATENAALFSAAFYLFLPFAIVASRSFQPDALMVMLLLASILAILRYYDQPSGGRLAVVFTSSALAIFIKPISIFVIFTVFILLSFYQRGIKQSITNLKFISFFPVTLLPTLTFYLYGILTTEVLQLQAQASFLPQLLLDPFFWRGWLNNIQLVVGVPALVLALLGVSLFRKGMPRIFVAGLWLGYVLFCLVFNYHIATHDYYHLQLVPIVALSVGSVAAAVYEYLEKINSGWYWRLGILSILLLALLINLSITRTRLINPGFESNVKTAEEIGELVNHRTDNLYLASDYGLSLEYHGELSGKPWPLVSDLEWELLAGVPVLEAQERFFQYYAEDAPQYFIILDLFEYEQQADLSKFLEGNYPVIFESNQYLIFDLQGS